MQIIETNLFRILTPEIGCKLINKTTNKSFNKVYLGVHDSPDNYIEVIDDEYVDVKYTKEIVELKEQVVNNQSNNEMDLDVLLLSVAKVYELVEPVLAMVPMTMSMRNEGRDNRLNPIVNMYAAIIKRGLMDIENIPESIREEVEKLI